MGIEKVFKKQHGNFITINYCLGISYFSILHLSNYLLHRLAKIDKAEMIINPPSHHLILSTWSREMRTIKTITSYKAMLTLTLSETGAE